MLEPIDELELSVLRGSVQYSGQLTILDKKIVHMARLGGRIRFGNSKRRRFFVLHTLGGVSSIAWYQDKDSWSNGVAEEGRMLVDVNLSVKTITQTKFMLDYSSGSSTVVLEAANHSELTNWLTNILIVKKESHTEDSESVEEEPNSASEPPLKVACLCILIRRWYTGQVKFVCTLHESNTPRGMDTSPTPSPEQIVTKPTAFSVPPLSTTFPHSPVSRSITPTANIQSEGEFLAEGSTFSDSSRLPSILPSDEENSPLTSSPSKRRPLKRYEDTQRKTQVIPQQPPKVISVDKIMKLPNLLPISKEPSMPSVASPSASVRSNSSRAPPSPGSQRAASPPSMTKSSPVTRRLSPPPFKLEKKEMSLGPSVEESFQNMLLLQEGVIMRRNSVGNMVEYRNASTLTSDPTQAKLPDIFIPFSPMKPPPSSPVSSPASSPSSPNIVGASVSPGRALRELALKGATGASAKKKTGFTFDLSAHPYSLASRRNSARIDDVDEDSSHHGRRQSPRGRSSSALPSVLHTDIAPNNRARSQTEVERNPISKEWSPPLPAPTSILSALLTTATASPSSITIMSTASTPSSTTSFVSIPSYNTTVDTLSPRPPTPMFDPISVSSGSSSSSSAPYHIPSSSATVPSSHSMSVPANFGVRRASFSTASTHPVTITTPLIISPSVSSVILAKTPSAPSPRSSVFSSTSSIPSPSHSTIHVPLAPLVTTSPSNSTFVFPHTPSASCASSRTSPPLASSCAPPSPSFHSIPPPLPPLSALSNKRTPSNDDESMGLRKGDSVLVPIKKSYKRGTVRFVGPIHHAEGVMIGVELAEPVDNCNDGSLEGTRYFTCAKGCGIFLRPTSVFRAVSKQKSILELGDQHVSDEDDDEQPLKRVAPVLAEEPTQLQSKYRLDAERHGEWNELFMLALAMEDSVEKYNRLSQLTTDFIAICQSYGKVIISEFFLPEKYKTLQTKSLGGVHGGSKFVVSGILFKLAQDTKLHKLYKSRSKSVYLFGKQQSNYEWASKAGGHELKGASTCFQFLDGTGLHVPMQCLVDYLGFRLICMPYLPIRPRLTHIYGSSDGGRNVLNLDSKFHAMMQWLAKQMHIAGHFVRGTYLHSAGDVEGHLGYDGRYYLLDLARAMPPEDGQLCFHLNQHSDIFYRLLRPELLQHFRTETGDGPRVRPLNPDCYSGWMDKNDPNHLEYFEQNKTATHHLLTCAIPNFAAELLDKGVAGLGKLVLSVELHRRGINVRHLGMCHSFLLYQQYLRSRQQTAESNILAKARRLLIQAMVQHTAKNLLRKHVRRIHKDASRAHSADAKGVAGTPAYALHTLCVRFLNLITGAKPNATLWWETILMPELIVRFGKILTLSDISRGIAEVQAVLDVQEGVGNTQKALRMLGIDPSKHDPKRSFQTPPNRSPSSMSSKPGTPDNNRVDAGEMELVQLIEAIRASHHSLVELVRYVIDNLGLRLTRSGERSFEQSPVGFEFVSADVEEISTRVKKMSVVDYAFARVLCSEVDRVSLSSGDRLLQLAIKHLNSSLVDTNTYNCLRQNRMTNARLKARIHNQKGHFDKADSEFMFAMKKAHDCNDVLTMTALGLEIMAMWQQRLETTSSNKPSMLPLVRQPSSNLPSVKSPCGSSSQTKEQEFLLLLTQSRHPALLRRFKQMMAPGAGFSHMQLEALVLFFFCGVFEPYHLYERHHPAYKRQQNTSRPCIFVRAPDGVKLTFQVPSPDTLKLDPFDELMTRKSLAPSSSSSSSSSSSFSSGFFSCGSSSSSSGNGNNSNHGSMNSNGSGSRGGSTHGGSNEGRGGEEKEDWEGRRSLEEELEFGDISVDFARSGLPFLSNPPPAPDTGELDTWRLDMFSFSTEQAFAIARGMKNALRLCKAPAWLLGPNVEIPLRRLTLGSPENLTALTLQQAGAQEMLWLFTALSFQTTTITNMTFKLCDFSLVSEMFSPSKQDQIGPPSHVMERVTDLSLVECYGINQHETPWLYDGLIGTAPLTMTLSRMPFGDEDCRGFAACAGRLVGLHIERTEITGAALTPILRACSTSLTTLNLSGNAKMEFNSKNFNGYEFLSNLTDLNLSETAIFDIALFQFCNACLPSLRKLDISYPLHPKKLTHDAFEMLGRRQQKRYPAMRWLSLGGCQLSGPSLEVIGRIFEELQFLDLSNWSVSTQEANSHLVPARCLPRLQHLLLPVMEEVTMTKFRLNHPSCKVMHVGLNNSQRGFKKRASFHDPTNLSSFASFRPRVGTE